MDLTGLRRAGQAARLLILWLLMGTAAWQGAAQEIRVTAAGNEDGTITIRANGLLGERHRLLQGASAGAIRAEAAQATVGADGFSVFIVRAGSPRSFYRVQGGEAPLTTITETSPRNGEAGVAVTRETILYFSAPLAADTVLETNDFYAVYAGRRILSRSELSSDRRKATLFYLEPLPGSARISVFFDAEEVEDEQGRVIDPEGSGRQGGFKFIQFDTFTTAALAGTAVIGRVFASELQPGNDTGTNAVNRPLGGVTITVDGMEQSLRAVTDAQGNFTLSPAPAGRFFVHIDGRTAAGAGVRYPDLAYYPVVGKAWEAVAGKADNLAGGTGVIYLPLITAGTLQPVSATVDTTITFPSSVTAANPALAGVSITVPANALFSDSGARGGKVGIAAVPPDRIPSPLPAGLRFPLVITVQTDGGSNFDRPAPVRFPNLPDPRTGQRLPPGAKSALWSFNHDTGNWEIQGQMTITADGLFAETNPGVGVRQPGWHGSQAGTAAGGGPLPKSPCQPGKFPTGSDKDQCRIVSGFIQGRANYCELYRVDCKLGCTSCLDAGDTVGFQACVQFCTASMARCVARQHECPWPPGD